MLIISHYLPKSHESFGLGIIKKILQYRCCSVKVAGQRRSSSDDDDFTRYFAAHEAPYSSAWAPDPALLPAQQQPPPQTQEVAAAAASFDREAEMSEMVSALRHVVSSGRRGGVGGGSSSSWGSPAVSDQVLFQPEGNPAMFSFSSSSSCSSSSPPFCAYSNTAPLSRSYSVPLTGQKRVRKGHETSTSARLIDFSGSQVESSSAVHGNP